MSNLDMLIDTLVSDAQIESGGSAEWLQARGMVARPRIQELPAGRSRLKRPGWTEAEKQFYREHLSSMTLEEIAQALGRSVNAVKCRRFREGMPSHLRTPGYLTTCQVARLMGIDSHLPPVWVDYGIMPGERVPMENRNIRRIRWADFKRWLTRPESWVYFSVERIKNPSLQRLVRLAQERWGDVWWSTRQAADFLGLDTNDIMRQIRLGRIRGIQAKKRGGRDLDPKWGLWFVRKSEVMELKYHRKGKPYPNRVSPRANAFIMRARADGQVYKDIAARMKWKQKAVEYRAKLLIRQMKSIEDEHPEEGAECWVRDDKRRLWNAIYSAEGWLVITNRCGYEPGRILAWMKVTSEVSDENKDAV